MQRWLRVTLAASALAAAPLAGQQSSASAVPGAERARLLAAAREIVAAARYADMATTGIDGSPAARIIDPFPLDRDFTVWIGTLAASRKVAELRKDPRVTLLYFNAPKSEYAVLQGKATFVSDAALRASHFKPGWKRYYRDEWRGTDYVLLRVKVSRVEVLAPGRGINNNPATWQPPHVDLP